MSPKDPEPVNKNTYLYNYMLGFNQKDKKDFVSAITSFSNAYKFASKKGQKLDALWARARCYYKQADTDFEAVIPNLEKALQDIEEIYQLSPKYYDESQFKQNLGVTLAKSYSIMEDKEKALKSLERGYHGLEKDETYYEVLKRITQPKTKL